MTAVKQVQRATRREGFRKGLSGKDNMMEPLKKVEDISMTNIVERERRLESPGKIKQSIRKETLS